MHTIRINPLVLEDLQEIKKYITEELENPAAALNVVSTRQKPIPEVAHIRLFATKGDVRCAASL